MQTRGYALGLFLGLLLVVELDVGVADLHLALEVRAGEELHAEVLDVRGGELVLRLCAARADAEAEGADFGERDAVAVADGIDELLGDAGDYCEDVGARHRVLLHDAAHEVVLGH